MRFWSWFKGSESNSKERKKMQKQVRSKVDSCSDNRLFNSLLCQKYAHSLRSVVYVGMICFSLCLGVGCVSTVKVGWDVPDLGSASTNMKVPVSRVKDCRGNNMANTDVVGQHTFTVFAIPVSDIRAEEQLQSSMYQLISDSLVAAGYRASRAAKGDTDPCKLVPELARLRYWSYMWFWPLMFEGGAVEMRVRLEDRDGETLWTSKGDAGSFWLTLIGAWGYETALRGDLSQVVERLAKEFNAPDFREALESATTVNTVPSQQP